MRRPSLSLFVLPAILATSSLASAAEKTAVVLPVRSGGYIPNREATEKTARILIENRLRAAQFRIEAPTSLTPQEASCDKDDCLVALAQKLNADVVVASALFNNQEAANAYFASARVYVRGREKAVVAKSASCPSCSEDQAQNKLVSTAQEALTDTGLPAASKPPEHPPTTVAKPDRLRPVLLGVGGVLLGTAAVSIGLGAWKATQNGDIACGPICERTSTTPGMATAFAVAGVTAIGGVVSIVLAIKRKP